jgi:hypothetical protein
VFGGDGVEHFEAVALIEEDAVRVVAVDAIERGERAGFHDDAVERIDTFRVDGVMDRVDRMDGMYRGTGTTFL